MGNYKASLAADIASVLAFGVALFLLLGLADYRRNDCAADATTAQTSHAR